MEDTLGRAEGPHEPPYGYRPEGGNRAQGYEEDVSHGTRKGEGALPKPAQLLFFIMRWILSRREFSLMNPSASCWL
jgi:hypothetical protein